ncbi:hypothetical protein GWC94_11425 [Sediminibacterium sp. WSJ-3]|nr:hypothetical protein [Sediminibacterium soli]
MAYYKFLYVAKIDNIQQYSGWFSFQRLVKPPARQQRGADLNCRPPQADMNPMRTCPKKSPLEFDGL